ncbi:hypothetical protein [Kitasatospora sp. NPDC094015]|uniref:hypothetical protein n=1 Tax=Kitasatospora sp. NPDC094015 TaxID=3155205 RepID=UPI0033208E62
MLTANANGDTHHSFWPRVREYAVPPSMIEAASARRRAGDWAGACAAAGYEVDLDLRAAARAHGREFASLVRADLRHLAPDLLRWHFPRVAPDGLLRPGLTSTLARYPGAGRDGVSPVHLVVRTAPAWADAGQRISLALWDGSAGLPAGRHPRPDRRFRLDLHRHLWDARAAGDLRGQSGADRESTAGGPPRGEGPDPWRPLLPPGPRCAVDRWAAEAEILLRAEGRPATGTFGVRLGGGRRLVLEIHPGEGEFGLRPAPAPADGSAAALPLLPDAATWHLPDLELLRAGVIGPDHLHPLVADALAPGRPAAGPYRPSDPAGQPRTVECRGALHRIGLVDGVLAPLDHDPAEIRREELLVALTGTPLPCLRAIDEAHRRPDCLTGVRERLDHGDTAGALAVVEGLLGPAALLRDGALRDELEAAARQRITYGLYRAGLALPGPGRDRPDRHCPGLRRSHGRSHPRHATTRWPGRAASARPRTPSSSLLRTPR